MPHSITNIPEQGYIRVVFHGDVDLSEAQTTLAEISMLLDEADFRRILADTRNLGAALRTSEIFSFITGLTNTLPARIKIAVIGKPHKTRRGDFVETLSANRALNLRYFISEKEALEWLLK